MSNIKKYELKNIIKEEIFKALKENTVGQSDSTYKDFPEVITYDRQRKGSNLIWTVITNDIWKYDRAEQFQNAMGYSPIGYGGPYDFKLLKRDGDKFIYTWTCPAVS